MTSAEWLTSTDPVRMLAWAVGQGSGSMRADLGDFYGQKPEGLRRGLSDRKLRLFAVACCRAIEDGVACEACGGAGERLLRMTNLGAFSGGKDIPVHEQCLSCHGAGRTGGLTDPRSRRAVEVAEKFADGLATEKEMRRGRRIFDYDNSSQPADYGWLLVHNAVCDDLHHIGESIGNTYRFVPAATQAALLREIFGDPYRPVTFKCNYCKGRGRIAHIRQRKRDRYGPIHVIEKGEYDYTPCPACCPKPFNGESGSGIDPKWSSVLTWNDRAVPRLAEQIYEERAWDRMTILADALEDAGCTDADILAHCRGLERCWRNCWPLSGVRVYSEDGRQNSTAPAKRCDCKNGWLPLRGPHVRGNWVLDLLLGKE